MMTRLRSVLTAAALAVLSVGAIRGQVVTASLEGTVTDPTGATVPGAAVKVRNSATNVETSVKTGADGRYYVASLQPGGPYVITVEAAGFKTVERGGITLEVNQSAEVNLTLEVGATSETVQVTGAAPLLEPTTAAMGQVVDSRSILNLPLNQRNAYSLVYLVPGVTGSTNGQYNSQNISINGGRPGSTDILVDGIPSSPPLVNPIQGFAVFPSVESVEEFKVQTNSYSAEFGRSGSGIINLIYKSGTDSFHGSAFEFLRNSDLDSNNFFANRNGQSIPNFKRSQFGGSLGGPVELPKLYHGKDKTFFFVAYEGLRQGSAATLTASVPTALQRTGDFSQTVNAAGKPVVIYDPTTTASSGTGYVRQPFPGNVIPASRINAVAGSIMKYYPLPNAAGVANGGLNNYFASGTTVVNSNTLDTKVDENINDRNRFFVRYSRRGQNQPVTPLFPAADLVAQGGYTQPQTSNSAAFDYTFTATPTFLMEFRYGFARTLLAFTPVSEGFNPTSLGFPSYIAANADQLLFPGIGPAGYYTLGNGAQGDYRHASFASHLVSLNNTKVLTSHVLKFGFEGRLLLVNDLESGASTGNYSFSNAITQGPNPNVASAIAGNSIASLLLGVGNGQMTIDSKNAATESKYYAWYFQDDWKATRRLTLNLGLRYDVEIPRTERYNRMETFNPFAPSPLAAETGIAGLRGGLVYPGVDGNSRLQFQPQWTDFAPRLGFAYQAAENLVLRGGYGIFYGPSYRQAGATLGNYGFSSTTSYVGSPNGLTPSLYLTNPFPNGLNPIVGSTLGLLTGIGTSFETPLTGDNKVPYNENWDFEVQRQLPGNTLVDVSYVGSHGVHLNQSGENDYNLNQLTPAAMALGTQLQKSVANPFYGIIKTGPLAGKIVPQSYLLAPFPQFTGVYASFLTGGYSDYNSIQVKVEKRFSQGLSLLVSFTGQKLIDDYAIISNVGRNAGIQNIYDGAAERAVSPNDISRTLVVSGVYALPFGHGQKFGSGWNRAEDLILGGWQLNGIATYQTGFPLVLTTQNTSGSGSLTMRPNNNGHSALLTGPVESRLNEYFNTAVFSQPAPFTFGNTGRTLPDVRTPGMENIDFSLFKNFQVTEKLQAELRAEAFNLLNQVVFGAPNSVLTSGQFGVISSQANSPRELQFALKLLF
jgi:hypothetical protein